MIVEFFTKITNREKRGLNQEYLERHNFRPTYQGSGSYTFLGHGRISQKNVEQLFLRLCGSMFKRKTSFIC